MIDKSQIESVDRGFDCSAIRHIENGNAVYLAAEHDRMASHVTKRCGCLMEFVVIHAGLIEVICREKNKDQCSNDSQQEGLKASQVARPRRIRKLRVIRPTSLHDRSLSCAR